MTAPVILWLRRDLRLADQPALAAAVASGAPVIPVFTLDDETPKHRKMGGASRWWLHYSLKSLDADLQKLGSRLILRAGKSDEVLAANLPRKLAHRPSTASAITNRGGAMPRGRFPRLCRMAANWSAMTAIT